MTDFLVSFGDMFFFPLTTEVNWDNPVYWLMLAILVPASIVSVCRQIVRGL